MNIDGVYHNKWKIINWFKTNSHLPVEVNGKKYDCTKGLETQGGSYKNGFRSNVVKGIKNKNNEYLRIDIYTSAGKEIAIEEKLMFLCNGSNGFIIKKWLGWNNVDLLEYCELDEYMDMLTAIYSRCIK